MRFSLKDGMRKLGPSGFPFEKYIGEILTKNGFETKINLHLRGKCAFYEIDFLAKKGKTIYLGECKYHHGYGGRIDLQVALYHYARFLDIMNGNYFRQSQFAGLRVKPILVTNTKFTSQAMNYSKCVGVDLLGWRYPKKGGLEYFIDKEKLYPITVLPSLKNYLKEALFRNKIALAKDIVSFNPGVLSKRIGVQEKAVRPLIREANILIANET